MAGDAFQQQWNLKPRIEALRAEAKSLRSENIENYRTKESELAISRDRMAREKYGLEQQAKSADIQVGVEDKEVARITRGLQTREAGLAAAEKRGDVAKAAEDREDIAAWRAELSTHQARARQAQLDAAELREQAASVDRRLTETNVERTDLGNQSFNVESEIDKMEQQADLLQEARLKYAESDMAGNDVARRAKLELEAEALVTRAGKIEVDRDVIRVMIPDLPDATPGIDAPPPPLPPGVDETSLLDPSDDNGEAVATEQDTLGEDDAIAAAEEASPGSEFDLPPDDLTGDEVLEPINDGSFDNEGAVAEFEFTSDVDQFAAPDSFGADQFVAADTGDDFAFSETSDALDSPSFEGDAFAGETLDG